MVGFAKAVSCDEEAQMPRVMLQRPPRDRSAYGGRNHEVRSALIEAEGAIEARCLELAMLAAELTSRPKSVVCRILYKLRTMMG